MGKVSTLYGKPAETFPQCLKHCGKRVSVGGEISAGFETLRKTGSGFRPDGEKNRFRLFADAEKFPRFLETLWKTSAVRFPQGFETLRKTGSGFRPDGKKNRFRLFADAEKFPRFLETLWKTSAERFPQGLKRCGKPAQAFSRTGRTMYKNWSCPSAGTMMAGDTPVLSCISTVSAGAWRRASIR